MTSSDDMLYCYLLDIVSHLQPLSHRCQLSFKAKKCTKFDFGWGSAPDPAGGAYSALQAPSWISGPLHDRGGAGLGKRRERGRGSEGGGVEEREREGPQVTVEPGPLRALLCHCVPAIRNINQLR